MDYKPGFRSYFAFFWGALGILGILSWAVFRLTPPALATFDHELHIMHWVSLIAFLIFMGHSEGYKGFQQSFAPRVSKRASELMHDPHWKRVVFAPFFLVGYFDAKPRVLLVAWGVTTMVICLIIAVRWIEQPWRGIIDVGVVFGLSWGIIVTGYQLYREFVRTL